MLLSSAITGPCRAYRRIPRMNADRYSLEAFAGAAVRHMTLAVEYFIFRSRRFGIHGNHSDLRSEMQKANGMLTVLAFSQVTHDQIFSFCLAHTASFTLTVLRT